MMNLGASHRIIITTSCLSVCLSALSPKFCKQNQLAKPPVGLVQPVCKTKEGRPGNMLPNEGGLFIGSPPHAPGIGDLNLSGVIRIGNGPRKLHHCKSERSDLDLEEGYELQCLEDAESFIRANGHINEGSSAELVAREEVPLGELRAKLHLKVKELTLYLIAQNNKIKRLETEISLLRRQSAVYSRGWSQQTIGWCQSKLL